MEIGKYYQVQAIRVTDWHGYCGWLPIIGPKHEDSEFIGFPWQHFHIDWRFAATEVADGLASRRLGASGMYAWPVQCPDTRGVQVILEGPTVRRMTYKRALPPFPWHAANWLTPLQAKYACAKLTNGKCPHRGIPVEAMIDLGGGILECPGHGLRWNALTGESLKPFALPQGS